MAVLTADFERGTNGSTISTGDTGSLTAWNSVNLTGTATGKYDNTQVAHGTLASKFTSTSDSESTLRWTTAMGTPSNHYGRLYLYMTAYAAAGDANFIKTRSAGVDDLYFAFSSTAHFFYLYNGGAQLGTTTTTFSLNTWYRIEWHFVHSAAGAGSIEMKIYSSLDSITPIETKTISSLTTAASADGIFFGNDRWTWDSYWLDQIVANATAYPGPFPVSTAAPTVSGTTSIGSTLTATTGTWNSGATFDYTYQWTNNGAHIRGATSSTYVTQTSDAGRAIGCKVTATGQQATNEVATQASSNAINVVPFIVNSPSYASEVLADNPLGFWKLDDTSGLPVDSSGNSRNATSVTIKAYRVLGPVNEAPYGIGEDGNKKILIDNATYGNVWNLTVGTIEIWARQTGVANPGGGGYAVLISRQQFYGIFLFNGEFVIYDWGASTPRQTGMFPGSGWHHYACAFNSGVTNGTFLYYDGQLVLTTTMTINGNSASLGISGYDFGGQELTGDVSHAAIYGTQLSRDRVLAHYRAATNSELQAVTGLFGSHHV